MAYAWPQDFNEAVRKFLEPNSIAVIGATEGGGYGGRMVDNLVGEGFRGKVFPVNPKRSEIGGLKCYPSVMQIEEPVDLAVVVIPARAVIDAVKDCGEKGIRAVLIISAGFSERDGQAGVDRQKQLQQVAAQYGIYICGPNCLGIANIQKGIYPNSNAGVSKRVPRPGPIGVVSQSGATAFGPILEKARDRGTGIKYIVSTGNEVNMESMDFIRYMLDDPDIRVIVSFIEGFKEGEKIKTVAKLARERKKPIILMKMGRSEAGRKAAATHTAAIAGSFEIHDGFFRQQGIVRVDDYDELCEVANLFSFGKFPKGDRVGIISHSGGICTFLSDECASAGFQVPNLSKETTEKIDGILKGFGSCENPLDLTGFARRPEFFDILHGVINDTNVDSVILATRGKQDYIEKVKRVAAESEKPLLFMWTHSEFDSDGLPSLRAGGMSAFISPVKCVKALSHLRSYYRFMQTHDVREEEKKITGMRSALDSSIEQMRAQLSKETAAMLPEGRSREILAPLMLPFGKSMLCRSIEAAGKAAAELGYPVVLKMDSPQILHKTECQGVRLHIRDEDELNRVYHDMMTCSQTLNPPVTLTGIMVQEMIVDGIELILGVSEDPLFGPILMLGWGGIFVEALAMAAWRVCPIGEKDAHEMIAEIPGLLKVLGGVRGQPLDSRALVNTMVRISATTYALKDRISSMDFNPIKVLPKGKGVKILDCRIILKSAA